MTLRRHVRAWAAHAALNAGECIRALRHAGTAAWHAVLPPQVDHRPETVETLSRSGIASSFCDGLREATEPGD